MPGAKTRSGLKLAYVNGALSLAPRTRVKKPTSPIAMATVGTTACSATWRTYDGIAQRRGERGDLDHVGVHLVALLGDVGEVLGGLLEVVIADDALGPAELADLSWRRPSRGRRNRPPARSLRGATAAASPRPRARAPRPPPGATVMTIGVGRSARTRLRSTSRLRQSSRNSTSSAPSSAAAFHSSRSEPCRPRPIVTQIIAPPHSHDGHVSGVRSAPDGPSTPGSEAL